ncbi:MAG: nucleotide exchange factor GrpE [Halieaceae bacterium]|nr:nucleotide exchange factor GrpE [Halieaceae bacterium]
MVEEGPKPEQAIPDEGAEERGAEQASAPDQATAVVEEVTAPDQAAAVTEETSLPEQETGAKVAGEQAVVDGNGAGPESEPEVTPEQLREELAQARDAMLRAEAEARNTRRRAEQDVEKARRFALERFSGELLSVVDNLERALLAAEQQAGDLKVIAEGVDLTLKGLLDVFGRFNIAVLEPEGAPFDPQLHQAMSMVENPDVEPNTVLQVVQKGYTLNGRLIRPAMVVVSKAPPDGE